MQIPWLIAHGNLVWGSTLALTLVLALWLAIRVARRRVRGLQQGLRDEASTAVEPDRVDQAVTLEGILNAKELCERLEDGAPAAVSTAWGSGGTPAPHNRGLPVNQRHGPLWLELNGARVLLDGPAEAYLGCREAAPRRFGRLPRIVRSRVEGAAEGSIAYAGDFTVSFASLQPGTRVQVWGQLEQRPANERAHREHAGDWVLRPVDGNDPLRLVCVEPLAVRLTGIGWLLRALLLGGLAFLALATAVGELAHHFGEVRRPEGYPRSMWVEPHELVLAATPWRRPGLLRRLAWRASRPSYLDKERLETALAFNRLAGECQRSAELLLEHGEPGWAVAQWERCPDREHPRLLASAQYHRGRFERASAVLERHTPEGTPLLMELEGAARVHLLAGKYRLAARTTRALARLQLAKQRQRRADCKDADHRREYPTLCNPAYLDRQDRRSRTRERRLQCVALALDRLAGDSAATDKLQARAKQSPVCGLLLAAQLQGSARARQLAAVREQDLNSPWARMAFLLDPLAGSLPSSLHFDRCRIKALGDYSRSINPVTTPLYRAALARLRASGSAAPERLAPVISALIPAELALGRHAEARRLARELASHGGGGSASRPVTSPPASGSSPQQALHCQAALEIALGNREAAARLLSHAGGHHDRREQALLRALAGGELDAQVLKEWFVARLRLADLQHRSAAEINRTLWRLSHFGFNRPDFPLLLLAASRLSSGQESLKPWARRRSYQAHALVQQPLMYVVAYLAQQQLAALQVEDRDRARQVGTWLERFNDALTLERALPLLVLDQL